MKMTMITVIIVIDPNVQSKQNELKIANVVQKIHTSKKKNCIHVIIAISHSSMHQFYSDIKSLNNVTMCKMLPST